MESFPTKHPNENFIVEIDFKKQTPLAASGTVTISVHKGTDVDAGDVLVGAATVSGTKVQQRVSGGVAGVIYKLTFNAVNGADTWTHEHLLPVGINQ